VLTFFSYSFHLTAHGRHLVSVFGSLWVMNVHWMVAAYGYTWSLDKNSLA